MAFVLETGTGVTGANSYIAIQAFRDHFTDRGEDFSATSDADVMAGAIRATDYLDKRFGNNYRGFKKTTAQGREWPRDDAFDDNDHSLDGVPANLVLACIECPSSGVAISDTFFPHKSVVPGITLC